MDQVTIDSTRGSRRMGKRKQQMKTMGSG